MYGSLLEQTVEAIQARLIIYFSKCFQVDKEQLVQHYGTN